MNIVFNSLAFTHREGNGTPLQYSCLENPMDGGAWWAAVHGVTKSQTRLRDFTFTFHFHALEKEVATHPSVLAWRIPGMGEPGGLPSMESHRVRHDWSDAAAAAAAFTQGTNASAGSYGKAVFSFIRNHGTVSHSGCIVLHCHSKEQESLLLHILFGFWRCHSFKFSPF